MCQYNNHYVQKDAVRDYAWKVMAFARYASPKLCGFNIPGKYEYNTPYTAKGRSPFFRKEDRIEGGAFHVFTSLADAKREARGAIFGVRVVRVAVSEYIASGKNLAGKTACYRQIMFLRN